MSAALRQVRNDGELKMTFRPHVVCAFAVAGLFPWHLHAEIIPLDLNQNLINGNGGPSMSLILNVTDGQPDAGTIPTSSWHFNPHVVDPADGIGYMDEFTISVASGADGGTGALSLGGSTFSQLVSSGFAPFFGLGDLNYANDATGAPLNGMAPNVILWTAITGTSSFANNTLFNDLGLALWWADADHDSLVSPGDRIHILAMVYSTGTSLVTGSSVESLTNAANISPIPEPSSLVLISICLASLGALRYRRFRRA